MASSSISYTKLDQKTKSEFCDYLGVLCIFCKKEEEWEPYGTPVRKSILMKAKKTAEHLLLLLKRTNAIIERSVTIWIADLSALSQLDCAYSDEIDWYNNNRRQILKGLKQILNAYEKALNPDYTDLLLQEEVFQVVEEVERDMKTWERSRTEQYAIELQLKRAFSTQKKKSNHNRKNLKVEYDTEYTDFSGLD